MNEITSIERTTPQEGQYGADCPSEICVPEFRMRLAEPGPGTRHALCASCYSSPPRYFSIVCLYELHSCQKRNKILGEIDLRTL